MALRQMLLTRGLLDIADVAGTRPTQAFIDSQGFTEVGDLAIIAVKYVPHMIKNHNSIQGQTVILGAVHQRKIQGLIYWAKDQRRQGVAIVAANWTVAVMLDKIERVNSVAPPKEVERPSKMETGIKWTVWDTKWENYLGSLQGASGIPLDYIIRRYIPAG